MAKKGKSGKVLIRKDGSRRKIGEDFLQRVYFYPDKIIIRRAFRDPKTGRFKEMQSKLDRPTFINPGGKTLDELGRELGATLLEPRTNRISREYYE